MKVDMSRHYFETCVLTKTTYNNNYSVNVVSRGAFRERFQVSGYLKAGEVYESDHLSRFVDAGNDNTIYV